MATDFRRCCRPEEKLLFPLNKRNMDLKSNIEIKNLTKNQLSFKVGKYITVSAWLSEINQLNVLRERRRQCNDRIMICIGWDVYGCIKMLFWCSKVKVRRVWKLIFELNMQSFDILMANIRFKFMQRCYKCDNRIVKHFVSLYVTTAFLSVWRKYKLIISTVISLFCPVWRAKTFHTSKMRKWWIEK